MAKSIKLSVVIPCLNAAATLPTQLEALAAQQWSEPWELILSDNGSTDNSVEIARRYRTRFPAFRLIHASNRRMPSHARNVGARAASANKLAFCDADDEVSPWWVALIAKALDSHEVIVGQFRFDKFNEPRLAEVLAKGWNDGLYTGRFLPGGGSGNFGIRRQVHEAINGFDECLPRFEDADYFWRLQLEGFKLHYVPEAIVQVRHARVNPSIRYLYRRHRTGAAANYWHYKRYKHLGMIPPPPLKEPFLHWLRGVKGGALIVFRSKQERLSWQSQFVQQTGDLVGALQGRITNPCKPYHPSKKRVA